MTETEKILSIRPLKGLCISHVRDIHVRIMQNLKISPVQKRYMTKQPANISIHLKYLF